MTSWWNDKLMKWQTDEMTSWWNDKLIKWQVDEMTSWWNDKMKLNFLKQKIYFLNLSRLRLMFVKITDLQTEQPTKFFVLVLKIYKKCSFCKIFKVEYNNFNAIHHILL